jgi:hypothetical protein
MSKFKVSVKGFTLALPALCASLLTLLSFSPLQAATWYLMEVDPNPGCWENGITMDQNHRPHIFYYAFNQLVHSFWNGSGWTMEVVAPAGRWHNGGPSVVIENFGRIHVAYLKEGECLGYALYDGSSWNFETVDSSARMNGDENSLQLDSQGNPHIAYITGFSGVPLRYAYKQGGNWVILDGHPDYGAFSPSLVLDSLGRAHIAYIKPSTYTLYYSVFDGTAWSHETVISDAANSFSSLVLDRQGIPNISYYRSSVGPEGFFSQWFAQKDGGVWNSYIVDLGSQPAKRGWKNKLLMTPDDTMHIAYYCHNEMLVKHAWGDGGSWSSEIVEGIEAYTSYLGFCADGQDLFISYTKGPWAQPYQGPLWLATTRDFSGVAEEKRTKRSEVRAYTATPNPFRSFASIPGHESERFALYDISGRRMGSYKGDRIGEGLRAGVYFLRPEGKDTRPLRIVKAR